MQAVKSPFKKLAEFLKGLHHFSHLNTDERNALEWLPAARLLGKQKAGVVTVVT